jgi:hypothetical protein
MYTRLAGGKMDKYGSENMWKYWQEMKSDMKKIPLFALCDLFTILINTIKICKSKWDVNFSRWLLPEDRGVETLLNQPVDYVSG